MAVKEWKNKTCPLYECEDRKEQARLSDELEAVTKEKNKLYTEMDELKSLVSEGALSINNAIEEILKLKNTSLDSDKIKEVVSKVFDDKKIGDIISRIQQQIEMSFSDVSVLGGVGLGPKKVEIIVSFLAILELIKRGFIIVEQSAVFENIKIKKNYEK